MTDIPITVQKMMEIQEGIINHSTREEDRNMAGARDEASLYHIISKLEYDTGINKDVISQAAFVLYFIAVEHPFKQANKRTAFFTADTILGGLGYYIKIDPDEGEKFLLEVARDEHTLKDVEEWIRKHVDRLTPA